MDLQRGDSRIQTLLKDVRGRKFYGLVEVNSVLRTQNDIADYLLQINKACFIRPGDAMPWDGEKFLLGTGVTENNGGPLFRSLRMIRVDHEFKWTRSWTETDSRTWLEKTATDIPKGVALCCMQATSKISDAFHVATSKYQLITNSPVIVDDRLDDYVVTFTEAKHGLWYTEVR